MLDKTAHVRYFGGVVWRTHFFSKGHKKAPTVQRTRRGVGDLSRRRHGHGTARSPGQHP